MYPAPVQQNNFQQGEQFVNQSSQFAQGAPVGQGAAYFPNAGQQGQEIVVVQPRHSNSPQSVRVWKCLNYFPQ